MTKRLINMFSRPFTAACCSRQRGQPVESPQSYAEHTWHVNRNRKPVWLEQSGVSEGGVSGAEVRKVTGEPDPHALTGRWLLLGEMGSRWKVLSRDMI